MALEAADKEAISTMIAESLKAGFEAKEKEKEEADKKKSGDDKSLLDEARKQEEAKKEMDSKINEAAATKDFLKNIEKYLENYDKILPSDVKGIMTIVATRKYDNEQEKANDIRKNILDSFVSSKSKVDLLPTAMQAEVLKYKDLSESDKLLKSSDYWKLFEAACEIEAKDVKERNSSSSASSSKLNEKFFGNFAENISI